MAAPVMDMGGRTGCRRCGTCCEKGGPSLHLTDKPLVADGRIAARHLFTIRQGERVRDNVRGTLAPLDREIIKIKGRDGRWTCCFYDRDQRGCRIYDSRPLECQVLDCRDTRAIERTYAVDRLTRRDLLATVPGLWDLIEDHEGRCAYDRLAALAARGQAEGRCREEAAMLELLRYDAHVRQLMVEKGGMDVRMLDFILGRPMAATIHMFALRLVKEGADYRLCSADGIPWPHSGWDGNR